ncbi:hypothetical protein AV530_010096 [Patagioenas fasciata monilis]|uniref:C2H2-type domain-containing protein n=1 Tax=Patagioenas fasciata monilis TaxID=372326 RepID=A0A1V4K8N2_PATFA|nr:hypothetical protein AV530_010096 [Patagioenas fasciata monilis]
MLILKAAKREILLCDFAGCGKIFSNRQYLNHHQKYQHVHQKTFACSQPGCGKSFNFKKHLKEHEKLHSGEVPPELSRRQRRRELDARRSRCRIRLGGHLERWCRLKDQLGFTLHSQLAQFLLDRFSSSAGPLEFEIPLKFEIFPRI